MVTPSREKAVAVAKDVLKRLDHLHVERGTYIQGRTPGAPDKNSVQELADQMETYCTVCLLGACVLSKARLFNALSMQELEAYHSYDSWKLSVQAEPTYSALSDVFDRESILLMECVFEGRVVWSGMEKYPNTAGEAADWGQVCLLSERIRIVMEEVIAQGGEFRMEPILAREKMHQGPVAAALSNAPA